MRFEPRVRRLEAELGQSARSRRPLAERAAELLAPGPLGRDPRVWWAEAERLLASVHPPHDPGFVSAEISRLSRDHGVYPLDVARAALAALDRWWQFDDTERDAAIEAECGARNLRELAEVAQALLDHGLPASARDLSPPLCSGLAFIDRRIGVLADAGLLRRTGGHDGSFPIYDAVDGPDGELFPRRTTPPSEAV
jgi:hypothetical protein